MDDSSADGMGVDRVGKSMAFFVYLSEFRERLIEQLKGRHILRTCKSLRMMILYPIIQGC